MIAPAQKYRVLQLGFSPVCPMLDVVGVGETEPTAWEAAATVSGIECTPKRRWDCAGFATYIENRAVG